MHRRAPTTFVVTNATREPARVTLHAPVLDGGTHAIRVPGPGVHRTSVGQYSTWVPDAMWDSLQREIALIDALDRFDRDRGCL